MAVERDSSPDIKVVGEYEVDRALKTFRQGEADEWFWDPNEIDISQDREDFRRLDERAQAEILGVATGFYDGEAAVTETLGPYMIACEQLDDENLPLNTFNHGMFFAQQAFEEGRHTDFFMRWFDEVVGDHDTSPYRNDVEGYGIDDIYYIAQDELTKTILEGNQTEILHKLAESVCLYMGTLESIGARGLYLTTDAVRKQAAEKLDQDEAFPGWGEAVANIRDDEGRHIGHGQYFLQRAAEADESIIEDVYVPMFESYVETNINSGDSELEAFDIPTEPIRESKIGYLQENIDIIGRKKFPEDFQNAEEIVNRKAQETQTTDDG